MKEEGGLYMWIQAQLKTSYPKNGRGMNKNRENKNNQ